MAVTFTTNKGLAQVTVGTELGTWGPYINGNAGSLDSNLGGVATVVLNNAPVALSSGQYQNVFIKFIGAITADVTVTFPAIGSFYTIFNDTINSSAFVVIAAVGGGESVGLPPRTVTDIYTDGTNAKIRSLPMVGSYVTVAASSTPRWITACTVPPWLNCDGSVFASSIYPGLVAYLGGTTLPDTRGRVLATLNQGTARLTHTLNGDTLVAGSTVDQITIGQTNIPNYALSVTDPGHTHDIGAILGSHDPGGFANPNTLNNAASKTSTYSAAGLSNTTGITVNSNGGGNPIAVVQPTLVAGITLIRAG